MRKLLSKIFIFLILIALGGMLGTAAQIPTSLAKSCSFCHYGKGCAPTTFSNGCTNSGSACSNDGGCSPSATK